MEVIIKEYKFKGDGLTRKEKNWATNQFEAYKNNYHIDNISDLKVLEDLCFREALERRYKMKLEDLAKTSEEVAEDNLVPSNFMKALDDNMSKIIMLKEKLGLFEERKLQEDQFNLHQAMLKKFRKWAEENYGERTKLCPHCGEMILFKMRVDKYDAVKHPFFKGRILANQMLWSLYKENRITAKELATALGCSEDYVIFLENKIYYSDTDTPNAKKNN